MPENNDPFFMSEEDFISGSYLTDEDDCVRYNPQSPLDCQYDWSGECDCPTCRFWDEMSIGSPF